MKKQMIWGLAALILLLGIAAVFLFIDKDTETEPETTLGQQTKDLLEQGVKPPPAETDRQPPPEESPQERHAPEETTPVTPQAPPKYIPDTPIPEDMPMPGHPPASRSEEHGLEAVESKAPGRMGEIHPRPRSGDRKNRQRD